MDEEERRETERDKHLKEAVRHIKQAKLEIYKAHGDTSIADVTLDCLNIAGKELPFYDDLAEEHIKAVKKIDEELGDQK